MNKYPRIRHRGAVYPEKIIPLLKRRDYSLVKEQKMNYYLSYEEEHYQFHVVDRFASFPLYFTVQKGKLYVSERVDELIPHLPEIKFDPVGYYGVVENTWVQRIDRTPYTGIERLLPGYYMVYDNGQITKTRYWSFLGLKDKPFQGTFEEAAEELGYLIKQAVRRCYDFAPDAAVHLSGGLDSGTVAAFMCQFSERERLAIAYSQDKAPMEHSSYESGFIGQYKHYYPQINVLSRHYDLLFEELSFYTPKAGNWFSIDPEAMLEVSVQEELQDSGKNFVFTGLGGDELASFIMHFPRVPLVVRNDFEAALYYRWISGRYVYFRKWIKTLVQSDKNLIDFLWQTYFNRAYSNRRYWYTTDFQKAVRGIIDSPVLSTGMIPGTFAYRLEVLERAYFSKRSDIWNFFGHKHSIDYLHPLLDADLVQFCASLPRQILYRRPRRSLVKQALKGHLPPPLLEGIKRRLFIEYPKIEKEALEKYLEDSIGGIRRMNGSFAATVYDYTNYLKDLNRYKKLLRYIPQQKQSVLMWIKEITIEYRRMLTNGRYLNKHF